MCQTRFFARPPAGHRAPGGFGPFDDDFDPFEDESEATVLIPLD